jgi:hypothetical protein
MVTTSTGSRYRIGTTCPTSDGGSCGSAMPAATMVVFRSEATFLSGAAAVVGAGLGLVRFMAAAECVAGHQQSHDHPTMDSSSLMQEVRLLPQLRRAAHGRKCAAPGGGGVWPVTIMVCYRRRARALPVHPNVGCQPAVLRGAALERGFLRGLRSVHCNVLFGGVLLAAFLRFGPIRPEAADAESEWQWRETYGYY